MEGEMEALSLNDNDDEGGLVSSNNDLMILSKLGSFHLIRENQLSADLSVNQMTFQSLYENSSNKTIKRREGMPISSCIPKIQSLSRNSRNIGKRDSNTMSPYHYKYPLAPPSSPINLNRYTRDPKRAMRRCVNWMPTNRTTHSEIKNSIWKFISGPEKLEVAFIQEFKSKNATEATVEELNFGASCVQSQTTDGSAAVTVHQNHIKIPDIVVSAPPSGEDLRVQPLISDEETGFEMN